MLAVAIALAGICLIVGAKTAAARLLKFAALGCLPWTVLCYALAGLEAQARSASAGELAALLACMALGLTGAVAWRLRAERRRSAEAWKRKHLHPRRRALPPPPAAEEREP